jgi:hypothetical protein
MSWQFKEPKCIIGRNRKGVVVSLTCLSSFLRLFKVLTVMGSGSVKTYLSRKLKGSSRYGHKVKLLVSEHKDFALVYRFSTGQLTIQFHYGEWNTFDCPRHPNPENDVL